MLNGLPATAGRFLFDVDRLQRRSERAQAQLTSGLKISSVSDSPDDISRLLGARSSLEDAKQVQLNLGRVRTEVDGGESTLRSAVQLLERARTLASQGASGHQSAATRTYVADELEGILERLVGTANVAVEGRYLFAGDTDQVAPYSLDPSTVSGVGAYQGSASTRKIADSSGLTFSVSLSADIIFDSANPDENVFAAVNGMRRALLAVDNPPLPPDPTIPTVDQALHNLGEASLYLNGRLTRYGLYQNRILESLDAASSLQLNLKQQIANIEEADMAEAITDLTQTGINLNAAFQTRAQTPRRTLFDYLG